MKALILFLFVQTAFAAGFPVKDLVCEPYRVSNPWLEEPVIVFANEDEIEIKYTAFELTGTFYTYPGSDTITYELDKTDATTGWSWTANLTMKEYGAKNTRFLTVTEVTGGSKIRHEYTCERN